MPSYKAENGQLSLSLKPKGYNQNLRAQARITARRISNEIFKLISQEYFYLKMCHKLGTESAALLVKKEVLCTVIKINVYICV